MAVSSECKPQTLIVTIHPKEGKVEEVKELAQKQFLDIRAKEPGVLLCQMHEDTRSSPSTLMIVEMYESPEALEAHNARPETHALRETVKARGLEAKPPNIFKGVPVHGWQCRKHHSETSDSGKLGWLNRVLKMLRLSSA